MAGEGNRIRTFGVAVRIYYGSSGFVGGWLALGSRGWARMSPAMLWSANGAVFFNSVDSRFVDGTLRDIRTAHSSRRPSPRPGPE